MSSDTGWLTRLELELAYFSGRMLWASEAARGAGVILGFQRVRPRRSGAFQPLLSQEITPDFLDRIVSALQRWNYDIVSIEEACARAVRLTTPRRFACLTFDGASKDFVTHAYPVLARHKVPFAVYVPTAFPDGVGEAWWLALEALIAREVRISLVIDGREQRFTVFKPADKRELFSYLAGWLVKLPPADLTTAIRDLCVRHGIDLAAISRVAVMDWNELTRLAADPNVTIGSATVQYAALATMKDGDAWREIAMGKAVLESALQRPVRHLAFPFGDRASFRRAHGVMAEEAGFASAVSTIPGVVRPEGRSDLYALPRVAWDGRSRSLRALRVLMSGAVFPPVAAAPAADLEIG